MAVGSFRGLFAGSLVVLVCGVCVNCSTFDSPPVRTNTADEQPSAMGTGSGAPSTGNGGLGIPGVTDERDAGPDESSLATPNSTPGDSTDVIVDDDQVLLAPDDDDAGTTPCERTIEFSSIELSDPLAFDVVIVADNSKSLSWSRDELAEGLSTLLTEMKGRDVRFFVLTPTQYGESAEQIELTTGIAPVKWRDPESLQPYSNAVTNYTQVCTNMDGAPVECPVYELGFEAEYRVEGTFEFVMPEPIAAITHDMSDAELQAQQQALTEGVLAVGLGGAPYEQPICTLLRYVHQEPTQLPERTVLVVISDEDDTSRGIDCISGVHFERYFEPLITTDCGNDCDFMRYRVATEGALPTKNFTCMPYDDLGNPQPEGATTTSTQGTLVKSCDGLATGPCSESDVASLQLYCPSGSRAESCTYGCLELGSSLYCEVEVPLSVDACTESFEMNGILYQDIVDYCTRAFDTSDWNNCTGTAWGETEGNGNLAGGLTPDYYVRSLDATLMVDAFEAKADEVFGVNNHFEEIIGFMPDFTCDVAEGQSHATNLARLASSLDDVFPLCESYAPALGRIQRYATELLQTEYVFTLDPRETLEGVFVTDLAGSERKLATADYTYDYDGARLSLDPEAITSADRSLRVELARHCTTVAR